MLICATHKFKPVGAAGQRNLKEIRLENLLKKMHQSGGEMAQQTAGAFERRQNHRDRLECKRLVINQYIKRLKPLGAVRAA